jgi:N-acetylmuramoyl-L-alanine amidase
VVHGNGRRRRYRVPVLGAVVAVVAVVAVATSGPAQPFGTATAAAPTAAPTAAVPTPAVPTAPRLSEAVAGEPTSSHLMVASATDSATGGYWLVASDGGVFSFNAPFYGSAGALPLARPVVGAAAMPDGGGYWLVASDGGIFTYGDAGFFGSEGGQYLNRPVVGMAATPDGRGYWLVASDGGIFTFGDAGFFGSQGGQHLNRPVVGMAATPDGRGYWLVASDGGIFTYGDAGFFGSTGSIRLNRPVVGMAAATPSGGGYWLVASDGGIFTFGVAGFSGAATGLLHRSAVGVATDGSGYRVLSSDGSVYPFGGTPYYGSAYVPPMAGEVVAIDPGHDGGNGGDAAFIGQTIENGNGTESCDTVGTETASGYAEHAFNFDVGTRLEVLLQSEGASVVMTRDNDTGVGPCVNVRAAIGNEAGADAAVSIHADGGPVSGRGFDVIEPGPVVSPISNNTAVVPASAQLAAAVRNAFATDTGEQVSDYSGTDGVDQRSDLGGLNLTTVPKVLIECANMQNPTDAALTESPTWRQQAAQGLADGITAFLVAEETP